MNFVCEKAPSITLDRKHLGKHGPGLLAKTSDKKNKKVTKNRIEKS